MTTNNDAILSRLDRMLDIMEAQAAMQLMDLQERVDRRPISKIQLLRITRMLYPDPKPSPIPEPIVAMSDEEYDRMCEAFAGADKA